MTGGLATGPRRMGSIAQAAPQAGGIVKKATRDGYGDGLAALGKTEPKLVVCDADLSGSTKTNKFAKEYPERFFNFGVAEQNLVGHAAGLALSGMIPFASSFAIFLTGRAWEIVRNSVAYPRLNVKLAATHAGITLGEDGASHQIIEDIAIMRTIPDMTVVVPADYFEAYHAVAAAANWDGPVYLRLGRPNIPVFTSEQGPFTIGKASVVHGGEATRTVFLATGVMVYEAMTAAQTLEREGFPGITVLNVSTIKPLDEETILSKVSSADLVVTFEEHNILGGLGSAIAELLSEKSPRRIIRFGLKDTFGQSGTSDALMDYYGLTAARLTESLRAIVPK